MHVDCSPGTRSCGNLAEEISSAWRIREASWRYRHSSPLWGREAGMSVSAEMLLLREALQLLLFEGH